MKSGYELTKAAAEHLEIEVAPNPSTTQFRLTLRSNNAKESITLTITDELGRMIETKVVAVGQPVQVGAKYRTGMYLAIATQGSQKAMVKLIKQY